MGEPKEPYDSGKWVGPIFEVVAIIVAIIVIVLTVYIKFKGGQ